jgi:hypothetical protein
MIKAKRKQATEKEHPIIQKVEISQIRRSSTDIDSWRRAIKTAESIHNPKRVMLYDLYEEIMLDGHLTAVIEKRKTSISNAPLVFLKNGKVDESLTEMISTEAFMNLLGYIIESKVYGHSLIELSFDNGTIHPQLIPRKHVIPEKGMILKHQNDYDGFIYRTQPYTDYLLEVGDKQGLGLLMKAAQYVIYKRGGFGDWAQYCELFGMPFRVAKYEGYDEKTRQELETALKEAGSAAYMVIPKEAEINFVQGSHTGTAVHYEVLVNSCNKELSKLILGQTMTTEESGAYAQAKIHLEVEKEIHYADKLFVKNILNEKLLPLLRKHGMLQGKGKFGFLEAENIDKKTRLDMDLRLAEKIVIDDEYFYETYQIPHPKTSVQINGN